MLFFPLINVKMPTIVVNVKMPTIVGILTFMSRKNVTGKQSVKCMKNSVVCVYVCEW